AAAQLSDRVLAGRRARLLHDPLVGAARRQAGACGGALRAGARRLPAAGGRARGVPHRRGHLHPAVGVRGQGTDHGVQDAALSRACRDHAADPRARAPRSHARHGERHERRAARCIHRDGVPQTDQARRTRPRGLACRGAGTNGKRAAWQLLDYYDAAHGISAMMRTTGYSLSITGLMQVDGRIATRGWRTPDEAVPFAAYVAELAQRGVEIRELRSTDD